MSHPPPDYPPTGDEPSGATVIPAPPLVVGWRVDDSDPAVVITVVGVVDLVTAPQLRRALGAVMATQPTRVVLDLSGVTFFGSNGLQVLVDLGHLARRRDIAWRLASCSSAVVRIHHLVGHDDDSLVHSTVMSAIASMR